MRRYQTEWQDHAAYLQKHTPLGAQQARILALRKTRHSMDEISDMLSLPIDEVEDTLTDVLDQWDRAQELCTIMGPHPWDDKETRETKVIDDSPWNLLSSAAMNYSDDGRTRVELELYHGERDPMSNSYLLVEREITDVADYATKIMEKRGAHGPNGLRGYIYSDVDSLDEYYLRWALLDRAGIDPGADGTPHPESVLDREISQTESDAAKERSFERVEMVEYSRF